MSGQLKVALIGNPNTGKSTLFNDLTGLNQKVGNFPGVTVDKKTGFAKLMNGQNAEIIDLPGIYSLYAKSKDEQIAFEVLYDKKGKLRPDLVIVVADASNLKRNLLLYTQVADLNIPVILVLNMIDVANKNGIKIDVDKLSSRLGIRVIPVNARENKGVEELKLAIHNATKIATQTKTIEVEELAPALIDEISQNFSVNSPYEALQLAHQHENLSSLSTTESDHIESLEQKHSFHSSDSQAKETVARYNYINDLLFDCVHQDESAKGETISNKIDKVLTHRFFGLLIFVFILFLVFQSIFTFAEYPMGLIETGFLWIEQWLSGVLPAGVFTSLLIDGVVAGLSGVVIFIPQIVILFLFIAILEDTGYMARVTFMMDKLMRKVGLNGKSVVPLISGVACAVPAIMSTRTIENWKDRIITILVTPLMSCSARLPVYTLLIALVVPDNKLFGFLSLQGLTLLGMYLIGFFAAISAAWVMKKIVRSRERGYFIMELPIYRMPRWSHIGIQMYEKAKTFVTEAGKVIIAVSIILWVLSTYGPSAKMQAIDKKYEALLKAPNADAAHLEQEKSAEKLETSYAGILGRTIEPVIKPLGYDWKIGIALITSFAAREVFVGTMATIYSVEGGDGDLISVRQKLAQAKEPDTGLPVFTFATAFSLMIFYAFAMQCVSTIAIVYRETKSIKWPLIQLGYMTTLAYVASLIVYQVLK
ncbi:ferrous iron transport protein B [Solitalea canadensis]|uniref:Ferrous iron transport protein B n=1 Tax=Solitalea canadensis (strain ATCC 29591 / DSM 3403 / JCM 21819 / LMG 8368 / NBRC 15130 / NCIMB 12057 / USAM 9D) TaxID=929556 RepID=H8KMU1_SOLCM|nr:ferrous iron transport protein B [Solitalea canadensis]AFD09344.1 ferrous iron transporter FeoB [Solitalea canadensis DSM 3403]